VVFSVSTDHFFFKKKGCALSLKDSAEIGDESMFSTATDFQSLMMLPQVLPDRFIFEGQHLAFGDWSTSQYHL